MLRMVAVALGLALGVYSKFVIYEYTCFSYTLMDEDQKFYTIRCNKSDVFDPSVGRCVTPTGGSWPCQDVKNCSNAADRKYVDLEGHGGTGKCQSYYICHGGRFLGHNFCPGELVFNEPRQYCDWTYNVLQPCGTVTPAPIVG